VDRLHQAAVAEDRSSPDPWRHVVAADGRNRIIKIRLHAVTKAENAFSTGTGKRDNCPMGQVGRNRVLAMAAIGAPVIVAALLIPGRGHLNAANNALILVVAVVAVAANGNRLAAAVAALSAAISFDFFLTAPYYSLRIAHRDDVISDALLLVVGLVVGDLAARGRAHRTSSDQRSNEVESMHAMTELVAEGEESGFVAIVAAGELRDLLHLRDCRFTRGPEVHATTHVTPNGDVLIGTVPWATAKFGLPTKQVDLPVRSGGFVLGHFLLSPTPLVPVTDEELRVAVAIADQVGAAMSGDRAILV
jgi:K+-sensing histidine kinase KdpD